MKLYYTDVYFPIPQTCHYFFENLVYILLYCGLSVLITVYISVCYRVSVSVSVCMYEPRYVLKHNRDFFSVSRFTGRKDGGNAYCGLRCLNITLHVLLLVSIVTYPQHSLSITRCLLEHIKQQQVTRLKLETYTRKLFVPER